MLSNYKSVCGLQICMVAVVSMAVPSIFVHTVLSSALPTKPEILSVCRAPQRALLPFETGKGNICQLDNGDTAWKAFANVNAGADITSYVEGVASTKLEVKDEFTTGLIASINIVDNTRATNLNDIECITFWIKSSEELNDDVLQFRLIADNGGPESVNIDIPGNILGGHDWKKVSATLSGTYDVDNNIGVLALYATKDPGNVTIWLDIVEARITFRSQKAAKSCLNELVFNNKEGIVIAG